MRKALVFVAAFAMVLIAGAAIAFMATPGGDDVAHENPEGIEEPIPDIFYEEEEPPAKEVHEEEPPKEEEPHEEEPPKEEEPHEELPPEEEEPQHEEDTNPPDLLILYPENGQHFEESRIAFEGKTEPGASVFAGRYEADVDEEGNWRIILILQKGGNLATFTATDAAGNESTAQVKAFYDPPTVEAPKEEAPKEHVFTAHQKFGECAEIPPFDVWYGTGEPGTKIWIESEYGAGSTMIGEAGTWDLKVKFPESPCGKTIAVVLETDQGHRKVYEFLRICEEAGGI